MSDRVLVRMPKELDYFLAVMATVHDYAVQLKLQVAQGLKKTEAELTIELADEQQFFFGGLFPRMNLQLAEDGWVPKRADWNCVVDFRSMARAEKIGAAGSRHLVVILGIMVGASPPSVLPELGVLLERAKQPGKIDILVDRNIGSQGMVAELVGYLAGNCPEAQVQLAELNELRVGTAFEWLAQTRMYIGKRSGATYLAASMGKAMVELYPDDMPEWWMAKPKWAGYQQFYGNEFSAVLMWPYVEEVWRTLSGTSYPAEPMMGLPQSTAVSAGGK